MEKTNSKQSYYYLLYEIAHKFNYNIDITEKEINNTVSRFLEEDQTKVHEVRLIDVNDVSNFCNINNKVAEPNVVNFIQALNDKIKSINMSQKMLDSMLKEWDNYFDYWDQE